ILIQIEKFKHAYGQHRIHILYVCEPIGANRSKYGYDEFEALHGYLNYLCQHNERNKFSIKIRPHPREAADKYQSCIDLYRAKLDIILNAHESLAEAIAWSDTVVGCETMAMVVALVADKKVYSAIPAHGRTCSLPHKNIIKLFKA
ncbi:MAG TPA: hypothetical protein VFP93_05530, partial [Gammaproteobacteria bacterium]|nr:hypothetical protein [Gammaproteobacteria bacterium]